MILSQRTAGLSGALCWKAGDEPVDAVGPREEAEILHGSRVLHMRDTET